MDVVGRQREMVHTAQHLLQNDTILRPHAARVHHLQHQHLCCNLLDYSRVVKVCACPTSDCLGLLTQLGTEQSPSVHIHLKVQLQAAIWPLQPSTKPSDCL